MPSLSVNKTYQDGEYLTEQQLDDAFTSIETFLNITGVGGDNIQDNSIGAAEIQIGSVSETKLSTNAVTTAKILDNNVTLAKLADSLKQFLVPTGTVLSFSGDVAPPGFLMCDNQEVSRVDYAALFAVVGSRFGQGDATTTFNVPDLRGRFIRMPDGGSGRDPDVATREAMNPGATGVGGQVGSVQEDALQGHWHEAYDNGNSGKGNSYETAAFGGSGVNNAPLANDIVRQAITDSAHGTLRVSDETRSKNAYLNMIIKT